LRSNDSSSAILHLNIVDKELQTASLDDSNNPSLKETIKLLISDAVRSIKNGDNNGAVLHLNILEKQYLPEASGSKPSQVSSSNNNMSSSMPSSVAAAATNSSTSLLDVFKKVENSAVQITSTRSNSNQVIITNGTPATGKSMVLGSGFVYDNQGHIVTSFDAIANATKANITFIDGNTYSANVIGNDPVSDIAVLQITHNFSKEKVMPLPIANSSNVRPGEQVIAIGNPFGLSDTMTTGIVTLPKRILSNPDTGLSIPNAIQSDAPINPGSSGGPLLNMQGQVIGMNIAIYSNSGTFSGIAFAVPSNTLTRIVPTLIQKGSYDHP
jgi:S1-C subfamily serine protease